MYLQMLTARFQHLPEDVVELLLASWRGSTKAQYKSSLQAWLVFCQTNRVSPTKPLVDDVMKYLAGLHHQGKSFSAVNTARSALSGFATLADGSNIGSNEVVCRLIKGIFNANPPAPRYKRIWDVKQVLNLLRSWSPVKKLSLRNLTLKLCMLIALLIAPRCQTLKALDLSTLTFAGGAARFGVSELLKTSRRGKVGKDILLQGYPPDRRLCVLKVLREYIDRTAEIRSDNKLFISFIKPFNKVSSPTIARWIRTVLSLAGIDVSVFKAHSVRAASVSAAHNNYIPVSDIMDMAGWTNECTFRKFYDKKLENGSGYQEAILSLT